KHIAARPRDQRTVSERPPKSRNGDLQRVGRAVGSIDAEQRLDQPFSGNDLVGVEHEQRDQRALTLAKLDTHAVLPDLDGTEDPVPERWLAGFPSHCGDYEAAYTTCQSPDRRR